MLEIIPSKDYKKFIEDQGVALSDWDKATFIYNHRIASYDEKSCALLGIQKNTLDESLKKQIEERLERDKTYYEKFQINDGNAIYILSVLNGRDYTKEGYYSEFQSAYEDGVKEKTSFRINKELLECKSKAGDKIGVFGGVWFCSQGQRNNIMWLYSETEEDELERFYKQRFEYSPLDLPFMFRQNDIVHIIGTELYGIVDGPANDDDELEQRKFAKNGDHSDWQVTVNLIYDGQEFLSIFSHDHIAPSDLEYAKLENDDPRKGMLVYMAKTLYDSSWMNESGRDPGRIHTVLSAIETVWRQYPDMRLGQLLLNACGSVDLFGIEDEKLLEHLQENMFPIRK